MSEAKNNIPMFLLVFYVLWGWFFKNTIYQSAAIVYAFLLYFYYVSSKKMIDLMLGKYKLLTPWLPFYIIIILRYILQGNFEPVCFWLISFVLITVSTKEDACNKVPYNFMLFSGLICAFGVFLQFYFPSWFNSHVLGIYLNDDVEMWASSEYGLGGFTYQLATTAEILIIGECALLSGVAKVCNRRWVNILAVIVMIICVFMTGKRTNSVISILLLCVASIIRKNVDAKRFLAILVLFLFAACGIYVFLLNADSLVDNPLVGRIAGSIIDAKSGGDFSNGRDVLWSKAFSLYHNNVLFGIGPSRFPVESRTGTDVHNIYIQTLCELGLIGLILFLFAIIVCSFKSIRILSRCQDGYLRKYVVFSILIQIAYVVEGCSENMNTNLEGFVIYAIALSILLDCEHKLDNNGYKKICL